VGEGDDTGTGEGQDQGEAAPAQGADAGTERVMFGMKESEIKAILAAATDLKEFRTNTERELQKVFGKFGDIQRQITATSAGAGQVLTKREINAQALKKLGAEYPEIAELLAGDLSEVLSSIPVASPTQLGQTQEQIDGRINTIVNARVTAVEEKINERMLTRFHKDWEDVAKSDDLKLWLSTQPEDYRNKFLGSNDAVIVADGLDKFKTWREQGHAHRQKNANRLENAIPAKSGGSAPGGSTALSDEAAFQDGFNTAGRGSG
jgi:hypothetical protein